MKNLLNLGKSLTKKEQKSITGGFGFPETCNPGEYYLLPPCNAEQQTLADNGNSYWFCICGYSDNGIDPKVPWK